MLICMISPPKAPLTRQLRAFPSTTKTHYKNAKIPGHDLRPFHERQTGQDRKGKNLHFFVAASFSFGERARSREKTASSNGDYSRYYTSLYINYKLEETRKYNSDNAGTELAKKL